MKALPQRGQPFFEFIWHCFGSRQYARNRNDGSSLLRIIFWWFFAALGVLIFEYVPFKLISSILMLGLVSWGLTDAIRCANSAPWLAVMNLMIGVVGLLTHWQFRFMILHYHLESYLFWAFVISGALALLRRFWNAIIWTLLEKSGHLDVV